MNKIVAVSLIMLTSACHSAPKWAKPWPYGIDHGISENASPMYRKGWQDGCETGLSEFGNSAYKSFYKFTQDVSLVENPEYYMIWKQAEQYCKHYVQKWVNRPESEGAGKLYGINGSPLCVICDPVDKFHGW